MSPCVGSPTDKRSLKIYKVLQEEMQDEHPHERSEADGRIQAI